MRRYGHYVCIIIDYFGLTALWSRGRIAIVND